MASATETTASVAIRITSIIGRALNHTRAFLSNLRWAIKPWALLVGANVFPLHLLNRRLDIRQLRSAEPFLVFLQTRNVWTANSSDVRSYPDIGEGLGEVIATHGNLASRVRVFIAGQIAGAVAAALFGCYIYLSYMHS
jgi:hypothetical protein